MITLILLYRTLVKPPNLALRVRNVDWQITDYSNHNHNLDGDEDWAVSHFLSSADIKLLYDARPDV